MPRLTPASFATIAIVTALYPIRYRQPIGFEDAPPLVSAVRIFLLAADGLTRSGAGMMEERYARLNLMRERPMTVVGSMAPAPAGMPIFRFRRGTITLAGLAVRRRSSVPRYSRRASRSMRYFRIAKTAMSEKQRGAGAVGQVRAGAGCVRARRPRRGRAGLL